jgi:competence ComEA-like helix-hairpin-helix protein
MKKALVCLFLLGAGAAAAKVPEPLLNKKGEVLVGQLNINEATVAQLVELPGIGPVLAERILSARQKKPFRRVEDLLRVKGLGRKRFSKLRAYLRVEGPTELKWQARVPEEPPREPGLPPPSP